MPAASDDFRWLRISFIAGTLGQGGAERQLFYILRTLAARHADVRLLTLSSGEYWEQPIRSLGIPVMPVGNVRSRIARIGKILAELRTSKSRILQSQHFYTNAYAALVARGLNIPCVGAIRNDVTNEIADTGRHLGKLCLRLPRLIAANSAAAVATAVRLGVPAERLFLLPNVVDTDRFRPADSRPAEPVRLLVVGRLTAQKRHDRFLEVFAAVRQLTKAPLRASIVGSGELLPELQTLAGRLGLSEYVRFEGAREDVAPIYREHDILVLTSDYEGTPNVVLEAMASGLPVVATRVGGVADLLRDGETGFLFQTSETGAMAERIAVLAGTPELRRQVGCEAAAWVRQNHSTSALPAILERLYTRQC